MQVGTLKGGASHLTEVGRFLALRQVLYHFYTEIFADMQESYRMTQMEINVLLFLANNPQFDTAAELVNLRRLAKSQVSAAVENLVNRGYLERRADGRRIHLMLTEKSAPVIEAGRRCQKMFSDVIFAGISAEERVQLSDLLDRIAQNARNAAVQEPGTVCSGCSCTEEP